MGRFSPPSNGTACARRSFARSRVLSRTRFACHKWRACQLTAINIVVSFQFFSLLFFCCCYFLKTTTCYLFCLNKLPMFRDSRRAHPRYFENKLLRSSMKCHVNDQLPVFHRRFIFCKNMESIFTEILSDSYRQSCIKGSYFEIHSRTLHRVA